MSDTPPAPTKPPKKRWSRLRIGCLTVLGVVLVVLLAVGGWLWWVFTREPTISTNYALLINEQAIAVPEDEAAWPHLWDWYTTHLPSKSNWQAIQFDGEVARRQELQSLLEQGSVDVKELHSILRRPRLGLVACTIEHPEASTTDRIQSIQNDKPFTFMLLYPDIATARNLGRLLAVDAELATTDGDFERARQDLVGIGRLSEYVAEHQVFISYMVSSTILERSALTTIRLMDVVETSDEVHEIREVLASVGGPLATEPFVSAQAESSINAEEAMVLDYIQRVFSDDGNGSGRLTAAGIDLFDSLERDSDIRGLERLLLLVDGGSRKLADRITQEYFVFYHADASKPFHERAGSNSIALLEILGEKADEGDVTARILSRILPNSGNPIDLPPRSRALVRYADLVGAIRIYMLSEGQAPATLQDLVPNLLDDIPPDYFSGQPIAYRRESDGSFILYSVGNDPSNDLGRHEPGARRTLRLRADGTLHPNAVDGDWIIYPPQDD